MRVLIIALAAVLLSAAVYAAEDLTGQDAPGVNLYEIITAGGGYSANPVNIDDFLGDVVVVNFWKST